MTRSALCCIHLFLLSLLWSSLAMAAHDVGGTVLKKGQIDHDIYVAGERVDVFASVTGDVVAAGGRVTIDSQVTGDVLAAGGSVSVSGHVTDDVRLAGGDVFINASVGDGAVAAGGNVLLAPESTVGGNAMLGGGRVELAGRVRGDARLAGGEVIISGQVDGNVDMAGGSLVIKPGAVIHGNLTYHSSEVAKIDPQAHIEGTVSHIKTPTPGKAEVAGGLAVAGIVLWLSLVLTGVVLYLLFPRTALSSVRNAVETPWKALGLGLALFAATPVVGFMLMATGVGWLLAWLLMSVYAALLLVGFFTGVLLVSNTALRRMRHGHETSKRDNGLAFALAMLAILIVILIPILGWLVVFLLLLAGIGGLGLQLYNIYLTEAVRPDK